MLKCTLIIFIAIILVKPTDRPKDQYFVSHINRGSTTRLMISGQNFLIVFNTPVIIKIRRSDQKNLTVVENPRERRYEYCGMTALVVFRVSRPGRIIESE